MSESRPAAVIVLAAGEGTRMKSATPKVLHDVLGRSLLGHVLAASARLDARRTIVVVGHGRDQVIGHLGAVAPQAQSVDQPEQRGTGHAVRIALDATPELSGTILVVCGDTPLLLSATLVSLLASHSTNANAATVLTASVPDPHGYGRIIRDATGRVSAIVEQSDADVGQLQVNEINAGIYAFDLARLRGALSDLTQDNSQGEEYLTDVIALLRQRGEPVGAVIASDFREVLGVNDGPQLADARRLLRDRINERWMLAGVSIIDPSSTYIGPEVILGQDSVVWPNTFLRGKTSIGSDCVLGPDTIIEDSQIGSNCRVLASYIESSTLEDDVKMGPFCHLRPKAYLAKGVKMGNFGEVKGSYLGPGVHMGHFSYIGDAEIGAHTNIGAGTITCNFDGKNKFKTEIGEEAFIGSDSMLVAPLKIGARARTGAGAVVTHDVPADTTVVGVPARPFVKKPPQV